MASFFSGLYTPTGTRAYDIPTAAPTSFVANGPAENSRRIENAIQSASMATGTDFAYLVNTATRESAMNPTARAATSTATGLFQFTEQTWLETVRNSGAKYGLGSYASQITRTAGGHYDLADAGARQRLMDMRKDPKISSYMAGELSASNASFLAGQIGRQPSAGELYAAHFLGAKGAAQLIKAVQSSPDATAAELFPRQAARNQSIFYGADGAGKTVSQLYNNLISHHLALGTRPVTTPLPAPLPAQAPPSGLMPPVTAAAKVTTLNTDALGFASRDDRAGMRIQSGSAVADPNTSFDGLFRTDGKKDVLSGAGTPPGALPGSPSVVASAAVSLAGKPSMFDVALRDASAVAAPANQGAVGAAPAGSSTVPAASAGTHAAPVSAGGDAHAGAAPDTAFYNLPGGGGTANAGGVNGALARQLNRVGPLDLSQFLRADLRAPSTN